MITGGVKKSNIIRSDVDYRKLSSLNYSMLKTWIESPSAFFDQFKLGKKKKDKKTGSTKIGDMTHFYLLDCAGKENEFDQRFDEKFAIFQGEKGSGQVFDLCDYLFEVTEENTNEEGSITMSLSDRFELAFNMVKADKKYKGKDINKVLEDFEKNGTEYFQCLMANIGRTVVEDPLVEKAKFVAKCIQNDDHTGGIFTGDVHSSFPIEWEFYHPSTGTKTPCKSEIDTFKVDRKKKTIQPYDLKCTWDNEGFEYSYLKYFYYLQQAFYYLAVEQYFELHEDEFHGYSVKPIIFVVGDTSVDNRRPLMYEMSIKDMQAACWGFNIGHRRYKGVNEIMDEIMWAEEQNIWNISKKAYEAKSRLSLTFNYEGLPKRTRKPKV